MPKFLFSKLGFYEIKDLMPNVKQSKRIDIVLNRKRRKNDIQGLTEQKINDEMPPSKQSCQTGHKFPQSLEHVLKDKKSLAAFRSFLQSEFSEENLEFWLACEDFRSTSAEDLHWKAKKVYKEYIQPTASREINVDHHVREKIKKSLNKPTPSCFDEAQKQVYLLMERDSCPRFLHSDSYRSLKRKSRTMWYI